MAAPPGGVSDERASLPGEPPAAERARARRRPAYYLTRGTARAVRAAYERALPRLAARDVPASRELPLTAFSFSGARELPEQVASIRSFLRNAGVPRSFTVISDGSHAAGQLELLRAVHDCVRTVHHAELAAGAPRAVLDYAAQHPLGKKLACAVQLPVSGPTLYADSDVLFFPGAAHAAELTPDGPGDPLYMPDPAGALDERMTDARLRGATAVNSGFFVLDRPLDWSGALAWLEGLDGDFRYHSEQTAFHVAMHDSRGVALPAGAYVLHLDDVFALRGAPLAAGAVLRHYVRPVRYRLWLDLPRARRR